MEARTNTSEIKQDDNQEMILSKLSNIKKAELKDEINTLFDSFNKEIEWKTPDEISQYFDKEINNFLDFNSETLKKLPKSISWEIINLAQKLWRDLKGKSLDWNISDIEKKEYMSSVFNYANKFANKILQETDNL